MIYNLRGKLTVLDVNYIVVECGGVGFKCFTSLNTAQTVGKIGDDVNVYTYLAVREDAMDLYAFSTTTELESFKLLIGVSGVGPKAAASILSQLSPDKLAVCVASGDSKSIQAAQGVGKKTAERVVLELKDKMGSLASSSDTVSTLAGISAIAEKSASAEAIEALVALGFNQSESSAVVAKMDSDLTVDEMIKLGLKQLTRNL